MPRRWREYLITGIIGIGAAAVILVLARAPGPVGEGLQRLELSTYDWRMRLRPPLPRSEDIVLVAIDEQSLQELGVWPWPRDYHAQVIKHLKDAGAEIIAFDVVFAGVTSAEAAEDFLQKQDIYYEPSFSKADQQLEEAIQQAGNVVLAARIAEESIAGGEAQATYETADFPHWRFQDVARTIGMANVPIDIDNVVRRAWLGVEHQEQSYPTLGVQVAAEVLGVTAGELQNRIRQNVNPRALAPQQESFLIDFRGPVDQAFTRIPYYQVLWAEEPDTDLAPVAGKLVFIGGTAEILQDFYYYPLTVGSQREGGGRQISGVALQASITDALLRGAYIHPLAGKWIYVLGLILAAVVAVGTARLRPLPALAAVLVPALLAVVVVGVVLFMSGKLWVPLVGWAVGLVASYTMSTVYLEFTSERLRRQLRMAWERRVAPEVLEVILDNPGLAHVAGRRVSATVLFADMQGFTALCHEYPPEEVVETLNKYLSAATRSIRKHGGTLHKFIGDGVMAVFGDPLPQPDNARRAVLAAWEIVHGVAERYIRVGVHTGPLVAGDIGSEEFLEYTVIGDTVSTASRLEGLNKEYGTQIMLSAATVQAAGAGLQVRALGEATVRGRAESIEIYTLEGVDDDDQPTSPTASR